MKKFMKPLAKTLAKVIENNETLFRRYQRSHFKGKLYVAEFFTNPLQNGVHSVDGILYDLSFEDDIQRAVYFGTYEHRELAFLSRIIKPGWTCLDIGANVGFYTLNFARLAGVDGRVFSIEACPNNYRTLLRNLSLNNADPALASNLAITGFDGEVEFWTSPQGNSGWGRIGQWDAAQATIIVGARTLDSYLDDNEIDVVDFLKIDIEGYEAEFLKGAEKAFREGRVRRMMIEYCGYALEQRGITLKQYVEGIMKHQFVPRHFHRDKIEDALVGTYRPKREILNLYFESTVSRANAGGWGNRQRRAA